MTFADRAASVAAYGFTPRQAAFLTTVMLHAGVCVSRQYTAFAHIVVRPEHARFLQAPDGRAIRHGARLLARRRAHLPRPPQGPLSRHWRARQSASPARHARARRSSG